MALTFNPFTGKLDITGSGGGVTSVSATSPITSTGGATPVISTSMATNKLLGRSTAATGVAEEITIGTGLSLSAGTLTNTGISGSVGVVDNSALRADVGTGIVQNSGLIIEDAIVSFSVTGVAATDIITATGSTFSNGQPIRFTVLTGGSGLNTTTNYYVINVSGATFQVSTSVGGGASLFTTNITAGTLLTGHSVSANVTLSENTTETNSDLVLTPKGTGALILGPKPDGTATGGNARGTRAVDLQISRTLATQVANGDGSLAAGFGNTATGLYSVVLGWNNTVAAGGAFAIGTDLSVSALNAGAFGTLSSVTGQYSFSAGNRNNTSATYATIPGGFSGSSDRYAMFAHASGSFASRGDAQRARFVLRCKTTTNTGVEMALDGATTYLGIPSGKIIACTINITGSKSDGTAVAHYLRQYCVKNVGGTSSEVYAPITIGTDNAAGTTIALSANNADDTLRILVTGIAAETWRWVASVDAVEVVYGT